MIENILIYIRIDFFLICNFIGIIFILLLNQAENLLEDSKGLVII